MTLECNAGRIVYITSHITLFFSDELHKMEIQSPLTSSGTPQKTQNKTVGGHQISYKLEPTYRTTLAHQKQKAH